MSELFSRVPSYRLGSKKDLYERAVARDADALIAHLFEAYSGGADAPVGAMATPQ